MKLFIILLLALPLSIPLLLIGFIVGITGPNKKAYLNQIAWQASCLLQTICARLFNFLLIKKEGYQFGKKGESTSSVLGKNMLTATLTDLGAFVCFPIDLFYKDHFIKNIEK